MDIYQELYDKYVKLFEIISRLSAMDKTVDDKIENIVKKHQGIWDSGDSLFLENLGMMAMFNPPPKRKPEDTDKELERLLEYAANGISNILVESWLKLSGRNQVVTMLNTLGQLSIDTSIELDKGISINLEQIVRIWNKSHSEAEEIYIEYGIEK